MTSFFAVVLLRTVFKDDDFSSSIFLDDFSFDIDIFQIRFTNSELSIVFYSDNPREFDC